MKRLPDGVRCYVVGGAVRDRLLGGAPKDRDWVVVGATPAQMLDAGFKPVGKDFPVFLHPQSKEEYALARTERKTGRGYHGFAFDTSPDVTLEEDLARRDLTINAMAEDTDGRLIDPWGGQADLAARRLRHVAPAFAEDPLRVLRVARFHARFADRGFTVADDTLALMRQLSDAGELEALAPERVWRETERALMESARPSAYFHTLHACGALARLMPELHALFGVPQRTEYHPEIDAGVHTLMAVDVSAREGFALPVRVAALLHDLGKATTPADELPRHIAHESRGVPRVLQFCERLRVPNACRDLAALVTREHLNVHRWDELRPSKLHDLLDRLGAFRRPAVFDAALHACQCDKQGRLGLEHHPYLPRERLTAAAEAARQIQAREVVADGFTGPDVGTQLRERRIRVLAAWKAEQMTT